MFLRIAAFEVRYLLRNPLLWLTAAAVFLLPFASLALGFQLEEDIRVFKNSAYEVISKYRIISCLFMFATTVFVSNIVLRDDETEFAPILRSTGVAKFDYLFGRFAGAMAVIALCLALVTPGILLGSWMPWAEAVGPNRLGDHLYAYFLIGLPNVLVTAAIFFALATMTRSMAATYVGLVVFLGSYFSLMDAFGGRADLAATVALLDPFSGRAFENVVRYWTPPERNVLLPPFAGTLLFNRLLWVAISALFLVLAYVGFDFTSSGRSRAARRKKRAAELAAKVGGHDAASMAGLAGQLPAPSYGGKANWTLLARCTRFEVWQVLKSPAFGMLLLYTIFLSHFLLVENRTSDGSPTYPLTVTLIPRLEEVFLVIPLAIIIIYTGELVWRERDRRMHEIMDAAPHPNWSYLIPKTAAVGLVMLLLYAASVGAAIAVQLAEGFPRLDLEAYALLFLAPMTWDAMLVIALATLVQVLSPHKFVGWGIMLLWGVARFAGVMPDHNLLNYAGIPPTPLSDMDGYTSFWEGAWLFRIYCGAAAVLLLVAAHLLWRRGTETRLARRAKFAATRLSGPARFVAGGALATFAATGAFAFYNTNVLNRYETPQAADEYLAGYEKKYRHFADLPQPSVSHLAVSIDLYPEERRATATGRYVLKNLTDEPVDTVHVRMDDRKLTLTRIALAGATLVQRDPTYDYRIFRLSEPMAPGETRLLSFATERWHRGVSNGGPDVTIASNGTFLTSQDLLPAIGVHTQPLVIEPGVRKRFGLPPAKRARLEDLSAARNPADGRSWATADISLSTQADQTPVAPGQRVSDTTRGDRRIARFVSNTPIRTAFAVQSARYAIRRVRAQGVDFEVFYHPAHAWNVDRMLSAMQTSLAYYRASFGPYQFPQVRIVEFPGYGRNFAQAFANTIPYSETVGFDADLKAPGAVDEVTPMTAHELAHQYWAHQLTPAAVEGSLVLNETLAQYSALMVLKRTNGRAQLSRKLRDQLDNYLSLRAWSKQEEAPLARAETQSYVIYNKGALVMNLIAERLGEDAVNRALRSLLSRYRFKSAPYARSADLVAALRSEAKSSEDQTLITDLFERIALFQLKVDQPTARRRADGKWVVRVPVEASKLYSDPRGGETEARLDDRIEVGVFAAPSGSDIVDERNVVTISKERIRSGRQVLTFVTNRKPSHAGIDPYNFYIDRDVTDNLAAVHVDP